MTLTPPAEWDHLLLIQSMALLLPIYGLFLLRLIKEKADQMLCMEHNLILGQMYHSELLTGPQVVRGIFAAIHDNKF